MTLTVDLHVQSNPVRVESDCIQAESIGSEEVALQGSGAAHRGGVRPSFNSGNVWRYSTSQRLVSGPSLRPPSMGLRREMPLSCWRMRCCLTVRSDRLL